MRWWLLTIAPSSDIAALPRSVGFPWGKLAAAQPQVTDEGIAIAHNLLGKVTFFPPSSVSSPVGRTATRCGKHIGARRKKPSRLAFSFASRTGGEKAFGSALPINILQRSNERNAIGMKKGGLWAADIGNQSSIEIRSAAPSASSHKPTGCS